MISRVIRLIAFLLACFASTFTTTALALGSPNGGTVFIGYDATVVYDGSENSSSAHEDAARPPTTEEKHTSGAAYTFLGRIADLLAAQSGGKVGKLADDILDWVGPNPTMSKPRGGSDLILRSADGTNQIRFDLTNPHGLDPHVNVETFKPRNLFPGDRKMIQTGNDHVFPKR